MPSCPALRPWFPRLPMRRGASSMPKPKPPHVDRYFDRDGKLRWYFRRGHGSRIPLPPLGTPEFDAAYAAALAADVAGRRPQERRVIGEHDTVAGLIASYMKVGSYGGLRQTSKASYSVRLE